MSTIQDLTKAVSDNTAAVKNIPSGTGGSGTSMSAADQAELDSDVAQIQANTAALVGDVPPPAPASTNPGSSGPLGFGSAS